MTLVLLMIVLAAAIGLALYLVQIGSERPTPEPAQVTHSSSLELLPRICSGNDTEFLRTCPGFRPELGQRFARQRRAILRLYLRELRREFQSAWATCRLLAPLSEDPNFGVELVRSRVQFQLLYGAISLRLALGLGAGVGEHIEGLTNAIDALRHHGQAVMGYAPTS